MSFVKKLEITETVNTNEIVETLRKAYEDLYKFKEENIKILDWENRNKVDQELCRLKDVINGLAGWRYVKCNECGKFGSVKCLKCSYGKMKPVLF